MLPLLTLLEERWRREGVGCVGPERELAVCMDVGSLGSERRKGATPPPSCVEAAEEEAAEAVEATEAECARRAESSRVRRLTCVMVLSMG